MEYGDLKSAAESTSSGLLLRQALDNFYPSCYRISSVDCTRFSTSMHDIQSISTSVFVLL